MIPTAEEIVEFAKVHAFPMKRGAVGPSCWCARGILALMMNQNLSPREVYIYETGLDEKLGVKFDELRAFERGFEGYPYDSDRDNYEEFVEMGQKVYELSISEGVYSA